MKTNFEQLKENAAKELVTMAAKIQQAETYEEAHDLWDDFSDKLFVDLTGEMICNHCEENQEENCSCCCHEGCKKWLDQET